MSKKGEGSTVGTIIGVILALILLAVAASLIYRTYFGQGDVLGNSTSCFNAYRGKCVGSPISCDEYAIQGYGCEGKTPFCCMSEQKNQCSNSTWNTCSKCEVSVANIELMSNPSVGSSFNVKCTYSANDVPCFSELLKFKKTGSTTSQDCIYDRGLSKDNYAVFACPALLAGEYEFSCELTSKGTANVPESKTCCTTPDAKSLSKKITIS